VKEWLLGSKPQSENRLDLRVALEKMNQPVAFSVQSLPGGPGRIPASLRELAPGVSVTEYGNRGFTFAFVLSSLLRQGLVLTDNRRLPPRRLFTNQEIWEPAELRDGAHVAAELYRLKNGDAQQRERYKRVQATFRSLTGQVLEVRAKNAPADGDGADPAMIIEPVVINDKGERPLVFCGAGVQEAPAAQRPARRPRRQGPGPGRAGRKPGADRPAAPAAHHPRARTVPGHHSSR
jgi:hypothetical protein